MVLRFKKGLAIAVIILFICMSITQSSAFDNVKKSAMPISDGNILYVGGIGEGNYTKIQDAIDNATDGDTVFVYDDSSPYYENVIGDKSINLMGENRNTTVVDGGGIDSVIEVSADYVNIEGFTVTNCRDDLSEAGINIFSDWNIIKNNIIMENQVTGIRVSGSLYNLIENNTLKDNIYLHIYLIDKSNNNTVQNNTLTQSDDWPYFCDGIVLTQSSDNLILNNEITGLKFHVGIVLQTSSYNIINKNRIHNNPSDDEANIIQIHEHCNFNLIIGNEINSNNGFGIAIFSSGCDSNIIYHNNFINNTHNAYSGDDNIWDNGYPSGGNYWDDYNGTDADGDGIGDTPYPIPGRDNKDRYPLMPLYVNQGAPDRPMIGGETSGKRGKEYDYTFITTDPDGDEVYYYIDWGDNTSSGWIGLYSSGVAVIQAHKWNNQGTYIIKAKAKDINGEESDWSTLEVIMPRNKIATNLLFLRFLDRFPLLRRLP